MNRFACAALCAAVVGPAFGQDYAGIGLGVVAQLREPDSSWNAEQDADLLGVLFAGRRVAPHWALEARFTSLGDWHYSDSQEGAESYQWRSLTAHAVGLLPVGAGTEVYAHLGLGALLLAYGSGQGERDTAHFALSGGVGALWALGDHWQVGVEMSLTSAEVALLGHSWTQTFGQVAGRLAYQF